MANSISKPQTQQIASSKLKISPANSIMPRQVPTAKATLHPARILEAKINDLYFVLLKITAE
ncbi:hypothetical protein [Bradyrhizobium sp. CB3481]|uniref:hypothetical protein n=1 Tax=Bradyrhizobium sp. CB3481 TaxID=3039158 RepID=UPI0024B20BBD|nr:hypothetical protein [Bradyrhizobium sp. CB3481]WFU14714.1 hypothetical protein QA643_27025 [Bradyrhizobium sp. CB3481]